MAASRQHNNTGLLDTLDCCGVFKFISNFSIFQPDYSSMAEKYNMVASLDTPFDKSIFDLTQKADFGFSHFAVYNPSLSQQGPPTHANQLLRNAYLRSRLFVKNAIAQGLAIPLKEKIVILDVGCENALSLAGIMAYFGEDKVHYIGIDNNEISIRQCREIYKNYKNVQFVHADGREYLKDHKDKFDLVLFQHPNLSSPDPHVIQNFRDMLIAAPQSLKDQGSLYVTFYYDCEVDLFNKTIKPQIPLEFKSDPVHTRQFIAPILVDSRMVVGSDQRERYLSYSPENYVLVSHPKSRLEDKMKKCM